MKKRPAEPACAAKLRDLEAESIPAVVLVEIRGRCVLLANCEEGARERLVREAWEMQQCGG